MKVIIYISNYNSIGGVETFVNNFCKRMNKYFDLTLMFDNADSFDLLLRASNWVDVVKIDKSKVYQCDAFICATAWGYMPFNHIKAKVVVQMVHADYTHVIKNWDFKYIKHNTVTHHVCVGQTVAKAFEVATPYKSNAVIYNLLDNEIKAVKKVKNKRLHLVSVTRLSLEKGIKRMIDLANQIPCDYEWHVWGNGSSGYAQQMIKQFPKNMIFHGITTKPYDEIAKADYLVQLSDTEGYCYSVIEALQLCTPCIITPFNSGQEQIIDKKNGYIVPFDLKNINFDQIINNIPMVEPYIDKSSEEDWLKILKHDKRKSKKGNL